MNRLPRIVSFGGWLAHHFNQEWGDDHSKSIRPLYLGIYLGLYGTTAGLVVCIQLFNPPLQDPGALIPILLFGGIALLVVAGWLANTVPFVAAQGNRSDATPSRRTSSGVAIDTHATGVVGLAPDRRRFRHRPAVLERSPDGELRLVVRKWRVPLGATGEPGPSAWASLLPGDVTEVQSGTAHLVTEARPAVCFRWKHGPVILDFADAHTRDRVYTELSALAPDGQSSGGSRPKDRD